MSIMFTVNLMFFIFALIEAGLKKDRFVVRENSAFEMECNHGLENVARIRWEYIATHDIRSEIIYDSQTSKQPENGFEVSCQLHETLISTCTLKLMQAKKKDSGKYICFIVEENETKFDSHLLKSIIEIELVVTGLKKDRYVMRENSPVEMDCNGELKNENVTRVRWEFISKHKIRNGNEIIYDSQSDKELKNGFEISCQPHQTFISKCTLTLIRAKNEDSGKYICNAGVASETKSDSNLKHIVEIELVVRGPIHRTMIVNPGDSAILPCAHNIKNITRTRWSYVSLQGFMTYNLFYLNGKKTSHQNIEGLCGLHQPSCNLKILQANKESAGRYICMVGESLEFEQKYGMFQMTYFIEIELVVGELFCNENMNKDLTLIGENDCHGIEADVLNLKCSFNYFGNINYNLLHLRWIEKHKFNSLEKKLNSSLINHEVKDKTNKISIQTNLSVAYEMRNSIFQCVLDDTLVKPCQLHEFRTQYVKNATKRSPPVHSNDLHNMKCSANKSANVQCSYYLVHEIPGAMVENQNAILPVENMNTPGKCTCIAKCHIGEHQACIIKAMEFEVIQIVLESHLSGSNSGIISALYVVTVIILLLIITALILKKSFWKDNNRETRDADNTNSKHSGNQNIAEPENTSASPPLSSDSASLIKSHASHSSEEVCEKEATEMIQKSSLSLEVEQGRMESSPKHEKENGCASSSLSPESEPLISSHDSHPSEKVSKKEATEITQNSSLPLEVKQGHVESSPKHDADKTNSKHSGNKKRIKPENPGASPPLSSDSATPRKSHSSEEVSESAGATKMIKKSSLEIKEILVQSSSKHGDIVIYESKSPYHSKVLMIDEVIWDTSFIGSSTLETMIFNPFECHLKSKKVLVIGRCEGRIVEELIRHDVESIDVYDIGESGSDQSKELYNLYCKYFPSLASYLRHRKVKYIDDGVDLLEIQQNVFDVIIIRSSWKSPPDCLFSNQYFESVKSALKGGGIALLIVSGQSVTESKDSGDFVEHEVQLLCTQHFPVVKYFRFPIFCNIDHPSCLTRVLLCGLNQGNGFEES